MSFITAKAHENAKVETIKVENKKLFWLKMNDIQSGLDIKNISDLVRKEILGRCDTEHPTKEQIKKYKRSESEIDKKKCLCKQCN